MCLLSVGDLKVNVSKGRMSLRTAMLVQKVCDATSIGKVENRKYLCMSVADFKDSAIATLGDLDLQ